MSSKTKAIVAIGLYGKRLCAAHYEQFGRARDTLPQENQIAFEQAMIDQGKILPPQKDGRATASGTPPRRHRPNGVDHA